MGTGKTTIAKELAREMGMKYVSIDDVIVKREGREIKAIFEQDGEEYFRELEKKTVKEISAKSGQVVDTGGGVVLNEINMKNLGSNGVIICLWTAPEVIHERTKGDGLRPLLNVKDPKTRIRELLEKRRSYYERADHHIDTTDFDVDVIISKIKDLMSVER